MFLILLVFIFLTAVPVQAARITVESDTTTGTAGTGGVSMKAKLLNGDSADSGNSYRENAEFRVRDGRDGDRCDTIAGGSDVNGYIYGTCYATQTGSYSVFVHSDRGDDSSEVSLTFNEAPAANNQDPENDAKVADVQPTEPVRKAAAQQLQKQGSRTGNNSFLQDGLVAEQPQADTGLVTGNQQVQGTVDTSGIDKGAPDLLKSLIFLTGALVLLIWSGYLIFLQIQTKKRTNQS